MGLFRRPLVAAAWPRRRFLDYLGTILELFWDHFGLDVRCSMFGCSMFDVMFGQADVVLCQCSTYDLLVFDGLFDLTFVSDRLTLFSAGPANNYPIRWLLLLTGTLSNSPHYYIAKR